MLSKTDLRAYFKCRATGSDGPTAKKKNSNPKIIASETEHVHLFFINNQKLKQSPKISNLLNNF